MRGTTEEERIWRNDNKLGSKSREIEDIERRKAL